MPWRSYHHSKVYYTQCQSYTDAVWTFCGPQQIASVGVSVEQPVPRSGEIMNLASEWIAVLQQ